MRAVRRVVVLITAATEALDARAEARRIAELLLTQKKAACVALTSGHRARGRLSFLVAG